MAVYTNINWIKVINLNQANKKSLSYHLGNYNLNNVSPRLKFREPQQNCFVWPLNFDYTHICTFSTDTIIIPCIDSILMKLCKRSCGTPCLATCTCMFVFDT